MAWYVASKKTKQLMMMAIQFSIHCVVGSATGTFRASPIVNVIAKLLELTTLRKSSSASTKGYTSLWNIKHKIQTNNAKTTWTFWSAAAKMAVQIKMSLRTNSCTAHV